MVLVPLFEDHRSFRQMKSIRQFRLFGEGSSGGKGERSFSKRLAVFVLLTVLAFLWTLAVELAESPSNVGDPLVGSQSYITAVTEERRGAAVASAKLGGAERLRGLVFPEGQSVAPQPAAGKRRGASPLDHAYHLLGGPMQAAAGGAASGVAGEAGQRRPQNKLRPGANIPNPYVSPWQYGLRAAGEEYGGGEDAELVRITPQGDPQPLAAERPLFGSLSGRAGVDSQMEALARAYYDAPELLAAYQHIANNQRGVRGGRVLPIDELRRQEDELPLPHRW